MRWLVDECVDAALVARLRTRRRLYGGNSAGGDRCRGGGTRAQAERRLLLTEDKDFGDLVFRKGAQAPGVLLLRIDPAMHELKAQRLKSAIERFGEGLFGRYVTVEEARFRLRRLRSL